MIMIHSIHTTDPIFNLNVLKILNIERTVRTELTKFDHFAVCC